METVAERVKKIRISQGFSQKDFAKKLNITQSVISDIENKRRGISRNVLLSMGREFDINANWILTGQGEIYMPRQVSALKSAEQIANNVNEALINNVNILESPDESIENLPAPDYTKTFDVFKLKYGTTVTLAAKNTDEDALVLLPIFTQTAAAGNGQPESQLQEIDKYIPIVLEMLGGSNPKDCGIVRVVGDSMTDIGLLDGDFAIFDKTRVDGDGVYVISIGTDVRIKHLEHRPIERKIVISSENAKRYQNPEVISYEQAENLLRIHGKVISWLHRNPY